MKNDDYRGLTFMQTLCLIFIGLRLTEHIDWEWYWVLSPIFMIFFTRTIVGLSRPKEDNSGN